MGFPKTSCCLSGAHRAADIRRADAAQLLIVAQFVVQDDAIGLLRLRPGQRDAPHGGTHLVHDGDSGGCCRGSEGGINAEGSPREGGTSCYTSSCSLRGMRSQCGSGETAPQWLMQSPSDKSAGDLCYLKQLLFLIRDLEILSALGSLCSLGT